MVSIKKTVSFCPKCYKKIGADIFKRDNSVFMKKTCSEHGSFEEMVERDFDFYLKCQIANHRNIYNGYFLDVTKRCNLKCKYCYYDTNNEKDRSIKSILQEAELHRNLAPFIITGGEPTLRKDIIKIIKCVKEYGPVELLTNGTKIDDKMLSELVPLLMNGDKKISLNISIHKESDGKDIELLKRVEKLGLKVESLLFVIDDVKQIDGILAFCKGRGVESVRIKAASRIWNESKPDNKIFVSDMVNYISKYNHEKMWWSNNKPSFFNVAMDGIVYMLVSWYDVNNVDLIEIACPPFYKAKTGQVENLVTAFLINEGIKNGYIDGNKIKEV